MNSKETNHKFPIAIVGIGCRYPGKVNSPESYWNLLINKVDAISEIPQDRWNLKKFYSDNPKAEGKSYTKWGGFIEDIDLFDPECFSISPREAEFMDPQQRLILEVTMDAFLDGGQKLEDLSGSRTGVFVGLSTNDYAQVQASLDELQKPAPHSVTGNALSIVANRVSYVFNLKGPSMIVDTACSSSLVATNLACNSLWSGECDAALAGGVNLILLPNAFISFCAATMLSPDGRCKAFDAAANGFVRGEGAGMVLLKPLQQALADGDSIYAVIKGSTVNHDGHTSGLPLPGKEAQKELLETAYAEAEIAREKVFYVEAHGTGTAIGDPVEANALGEMFGPNRTTGEKCLIGSVKSNIGHLEGGAGIAALIKAALCIKKRVVPASLHFVSPNPEIAFDKFNLAVPTEPVNFPPKRPDGVVVGINAFGIGGTNAHVILSDFTPPEESKSQSALSEQTCKNDKPFYLLPLSAQNPEGLKILADNYLTYFNLDYTPPLNDICFSASQHRPHYQQRLTLAGSNKSDLKEQLKAFINNETRPGMSLNQMRRNASNKLVFVFSGQGPQWWAMGRELLEKEPVFRAKIKECDQLFKTFADWSLWDEFCADEEKSNISDTSISQPLIFALQVALAALWQSRGIKPDAIVGHSVGEVAAAYIAGAFDLTTALKIIYFRGHCMKFADKDGRMAAVGLGHDDIEKVIKPYLGKVSISAINSPNSVTLSGDENALTEISEKMEKEGIFFRFLVVQYAFHSNRMDPVEEPLLKALTTLQLEDIKTPIFSTVSGKQVTKNCFDADYWWHNVRDKVCFGPAIENLLAEGYDTFIEIGPHPVLATSIYECAGSNKPAVLTSLRRKENERLNFFASLGALHCIGYPLDWNAINDVDSRFCKIPGYPWQRQSYWHESAKWAELRMGQVVHPLLAVRCESADPCWNTELDSDLLTYLSDHRVRQKIVFPAAAYVEMALAAALYLFSKESIILEHILLQKALFISEENLPTIQLSFVREDSTFTIRSAANHHDDIWNSHCTGYIRSRPALKDLKTKTSLADLQSSICETVPSEKFYAEMEGSGLNFGPLFRGAKKLYKGLNQALAEISLPEILHSNFDAYNFHPTLLDASFQTISLAAEKTLTSISAHNLYLPIEIEQVRFYGKMEKQVWVHSQAKIINQKILVGDIHIYSPSGKLLLELKGFRCQAVTSFGSGQEVNEFRYSWNWQPYCQSLTARAGIDYLPEKISLALIMQEEAKKNCSKFDKHLRIPAYRGLDKLALDYIHNALYELGCNFQAGFTSFDEWSKQLGIVDTQQKQLKNFFNILTIAGYTEHKEPDLWQFVCPPPQPRLQELERSLLLNYPIVFSETTMVSSFGRHLASIMRGEKDPLQILFPNNSTDAAEHFYIDSLSYQGGNRMIAKAVSTICQALPAGRSLRILEVGAGTGSLTSSILHLLPKERVDYCFTDISNFFFPRAEQKFSDYPFVSFKTLNLEEDIKPQGFQAQSFDLILASDVIHATLNLEESLNHLQELLTSRGILIFTEPVEPVNENIAWVEMIFGLFDGWWRFNDPKWRLSGPLLNQQNWKKLLHESNFSAIKALSQFPDDPDHAHQIIIAHGPQKPTSSITLSEKNSGETEITTKTWLIYANAIEDTNEITEFLKDRGDTCLRLQPECISDNSAAATEDFLATLDNSNNITLLFFGNMESPSPETLELKTFAEIEENGIISLIELLQKLQKEDLLLKITRLLVITRGVQPLYLPAHKMGVAQFSIIGLVRVIQNEYPNIFCKSIDLDPEVPIAPTLYNELFTEDDEDEIIIRHGNRYVPRLQKAENNVISVSRTAENSPLFTLEVAAAGSINNLHFQEINSPTLQSDEVEISVEAASLNFRDVMKTLGLYPAGDGNDWQLGDECAGIVTNTGSNVTNFRTGDKVVVIGTACMSSRVVTKAQYLIHKPDHISFAEAVTIPIVFLTVYYALHQLANIGKGDRILIQAAAGGIGLAAIQVAQNAGAQIFATAGSPEKRNLLRSLGVTEVMDSRSLAFADELMLRTDGKGVDIILNSLAGEALYQGIECLAPYGHFLELGKIDIFKNSKFGLRALRRNISFHAIDLASMLNDKPELSASLLRRVFNDLQDHIIHPLPYRQFPLARVKEAFRYMAQGKHIGKVVISFNDEQISLSPLPTPKKSLFAPDCSYLITGGLGGFGVTIAHWIIENGGRNIILVSRQGTKTPGAQETVLKLENAGGKILVAAVDICDPDEVDNLMLQIKKEMPQLKGIFHAAMVIDDGIITQLNRKRVQKVTAPKIYGSWNLHNATRQLKLDYFVLFSSISSLIGNPGQGSYVAANFFLDSFAAYRRALQLPAIAINWGALAEVGFVARNQTVSNLLARKGLDGMQPAMAMQALGKILNENPVQTGPAKINFQEWGKEFIHRNIPPRFSRILQENDLIQSNSDGSSIIRELLEQAGPSEHKEIMQNYLREQIALVLRISADRLQADQPLNELGMDSLMMVELSVRIENDLATSLPAAQLGSNPTLIDLADILLTTMGKGAPGRAAKGLNDLPENGQISSSKCLVPLRSKGSKPILFCFHPVGGDVGIYTDMVNALADEYPVYAIQSRVFSDSGDEHKSYTEMTEAYTEIIINQQSSGPYFLMGFSFGGFLALTIAHRLEEKGYTVSLTGLIDCNIQSTLPAFQEQTRNFFISEMYHHIITIFQERLQIPLAKQEEDCQKMLTAIKDSGTAEYEKTICDWLTEHQYLHDNVEIELAYKYFQLTRVHLELLQQFTLPSTTTNLVQWIAEKSFTGTNESEKLFAANSGPSELFRLPVTHFKILSHPVVIDLVKQLEEKLLESS